MLGSKMGTKMVPVRALKAPSTISRAKFRGDAIRDDGRSPNPLFGCEMAGFRVDVFGKFLVDFLGCTKQMNDTCAWTPNNKSLRHPGDEQSILGSQGLGTLS